MAANDNTYQKQLDVIQEIRLLAGDCDGSQLKLPQIAVVGDQSSGKSSVLEALTKVRFPVQSGICTKVPIVVHCKRNRHLTETNYQVQSEDGTNVPVALEDLSKEISETQEKALYAISRLENRLVKVSTKEIFVTVTGPDQMDIIIVDLPGIILNGEGKEETKSLIEHYIMREETLIFLVSEAKQDIELVTAIELAKKADADEDRTIRVLTKFDTFDSDTSRDRALGLISMQKRKNALASTPEAEESKQDNGLAPHGVICRVGGAAEYEVSNEVEALTKAGVDLDTCRAGIPALAERLPEIFARLIKSNLPRLQQSIIERRARAQNDLLKIGREPVSKAEMLSNMRFALTTALDELQRTISEDLLNFQEQVHRAKDRIQREWTDAMLKPDVFMCPLYVGEDAMRRCMSEITKKWWQPMQDDLLKNMHRKTSVAMLGSIDVAQGVSTLLRSVLSPLCKEHLDSVLLKGLQKAFSNTLKVESDWGTMNHYFTAKFQAEMMLPDEFIDEFAESIDLEKDIKCGTGKTLTFLGKTHWIPLDITNVRTNLKNKLIGQKRHREVAFSGKTLQEQQKERLFFAVKAQYEVEKKTYTDNILKQTRESLLNVCSTWVSNDLFFVEKIMAAAVEDTHVTEERERLCRTIEKMTQCTAELRKVGL